MQCSTVLLKIIMLDKQLNDIPLWSILINAWWPPAALIHMKDGYIQTHHCLRQKQNVSWRSKGVITHFQLTSVKWFFSTQIGLKHRPTGKSTDRNRNTSSGSVWSLSEREHGSFDGRTLSLQSNTAQLLKLRDEGCCWCLGCSTRVTELFI